MAGHRIRGEALREPLAAPVDRIGGQFAPGEIARRAAVFLDILGATGKQEHGAARRLRRPKADAQAHPVLGVQPVGTAVPGAIGDILEERRGLEMRRRQAHASRLPSFMATPMSPSTRSLPDMKAEVGLRSPSRIA